jgi:DNA-directed RNA polymerase specialized sigma24 family protein
LAFWIVRDQVDADDIVQESYLRAYHGFPGFAGPNIIAWLLAIVRNEAFQWMSKNVISMEFLSVI